jgi:hypothetical protein
MEGLVRWEGVIPKSPRLWILEWRASRLLLGERVRPRAQSGEPRVRHGKLHRPSAAIFFSHPTRARGCAPGAGALPETTRLPQVTSARKVQKLSAFGIIPIALDSRLLCCWASVSLAIKWLTLAGGTPAPLSKSPKANFFWYKGLRFPHGMSVRDPKRKKLKSASMRGIPAGF